MSKLVENSRLLVGSARSLLVGVVLLLVGCGGYPECSGTLIGGYDTGGGEYGYLQGTLTGNRYVGTAISVAGNGETTVIAEIRGDVMIGESAGGVTGRLTRVPFTCSFEGYTSDPFGNRGLVVLWPTLRAEADLPDRWWDQRDEP